MYTFSRHPRASAKDLRQPDDAMRHHKDLNGCLTVVKEKIKLAYRTEEETVRDRHDEERSGNNRRKLGEVFWLALMDSRLSPRQSLWRIHVARTITEEKCFPAPSLRDRHEKGQLIK